MPHKIQISGVIGWDVLASDVKDQLAEIKPADEIDVEINSPGGSVFEGIAISNLVKSHEGQTNVIITGLAASMGSYIAMAGDTIKANDDATFMIHNASTIEWGDHRALRKTANVIESLTGLLSKAYSKKTGLENSEIRGLMDDETWLFGDEILKFGFVDEIIESEKPEDKDEAVAFQKLVFQDSIEKISKSKTAKQDVDKLAAYFEINTKQNAGGKSNLSADSTPETGPNPVNSPATAKNEENMTLAEYLKANPTAQAEIDKMVADGKTKALATEQAVKKELSAKIMPIIESKAYDSDFTKMGIEVLAGERSMQSFDDFVIMFDKVNEKAKSDLIKKDQPPATPGETGPSEKQALEGKTQASAEELKKAINDQTKVQQ